MEQANGEAAQATPQQTLARTQQLLQQEPYKSFIKPDQFTPANFPPTLLSAAQLDQYRNGFKTLWDTILKTPADHAMHQQAVGKLSEASKKLLSSRREELNKRQQQLQQQKAQTQAANQTQPQQQQAQSQARQSALQAANGGDAAQPQNMSTAALLAQLPPDTRQKIEKTPWTLPINIQEGTTQAEEYRAEAMRRYAQGMVNLSKPMMAIKELDLAMQVATKSGAPGPEDYATRRGQLQKAYNDAKLFVENLLKMEQNNKAQRSGGTMAAQSAIAQNRAAQANANAQGQAARAAAAAANPAAATPQSATTPQNAQGFQRPAAPTIPHLNHNDSNGVPSYTPNQALAAATAGRNQQSPSQQTPQAPQIFHESRQLAQGEVEQRKAGIPISKGYVPQPPQAVAMGASRPTLSGPSQGPMGSMGQPALQKPDTFLLQGPGDHVLDKKRLDELVRQVCGADAGEEDALLPEVEELADEFVDNVVTSACKLAKLRGSQMLELRDIQLVLERQYNIRIPGFATDEVRTVRKSAPAPGYYQKINAVQAAKVMGGRGDL